jgi:hypothetical protein
MSTQRAAETGLCITCIAVHACKKSNLVFMAQITDLPSRKDAVRAMNLRFGKMTAGEHSIIFSKLDMGDNKTSSCRSILNSQKPYVNSRCPTTITNHMVQNYTNYAPNISIILAMVVHGTLQNICKSSSSYLQILRL